MKQKMYQKIQLLPASESDDLTRWWWWWSEWSEVVNVAVCALIQRMEFSSTRILFDSSRLPPVAITKLSVHWNSKSSILWRKQFLTFAVCHYRSLNLQWLRQSILLTSSSLSPWYHSALVSKGSQHRWITSDLLQDDSLIESLDYELLVQFKRKIGSWRINSGFGHFLFIVLKFM